ncbi:hypothetical protein KR018_002519, partial [Drosophila ironensis]
ATRYNVSFAQLDTCNSYEIREAGYAYRDFFVVHSLDNKQLREGERLHLKFYVLTSKDAHILLSVAKQPRSNDRVYEIVIGAGENTFSTIRTTMGARRVSTNQDHNLLSVYEPTPIEIVQTQNGDLLVYIPGFKEEPLLKFTDPDPLTINYLSFSSFGLNRARWFYDCSFDGFDKELTPGTTQPSTEQKLLAYLNSRAENASLPAHLGSLLFHFQTRSLAYEPFNALFHTRMHLLMHWQDERMSWLPADYGNLESLQHRQLEIWMPHMTVLNGALQSMGNVLRGDYELRVYANGNISLYMSNLPVHTWCVDTARNWPNEQVTCEIQLALISQPGEGSLNLVYDRQRNPIAPNEHVNTPSGWTFLDISVVQVTNGSQSRYTPRDTLQTMAGDAVIEFTLQRNSRFYMTVFYLPLIACQVFLILSFVLRSTRRSALILVSLLISAWALMYMTRHASPHYVPQLMSSYKVIMAATTYCYILHICIVWLELYPPKIKVCGILLAIINSNVLRFALGLRLSDSSDFCDVQEKPWSHLAKMLNNLSCIVVTIIIAIQNVSSGF